MTPVSLMLAEGRLTPLQARAATRLISDWQGALRWLDRGKPPRDAGQARAYKDALVALGPLRAVVVGVCVNNETVAQWAARERFGEAGTLRMLQTALDTLAGHYGMGERGAAQGAGTHAHPDLGSSPA